MILQKSVQCSAQHFWLAAGRNLSGHAKLVEHGEDDPSLVVKRHDKLRAAAGQHRGRGEHLAGKQHVRRPGQRFSAERR